MKHKSITTSSPLARGFTLLELLVAILLVSIISAAIFSTLQTAFKLKDRAEIALEPLQRANIALDFIQRDLEAALPPTSNAANILVNEFVGTDGQGDSGTSADDVIFCCSTDAPAIISFPTDIRKVEYTLSTEGNDHQLIRYVTSNLLAPTTVDPDQETICRGVRSLNFEYFDGTNWNDSWDSTTASTTIPANSIPMMVRVIIELAPLSAKGQGLTVERWIRLPASKLTAGSTTGVTQ